MGGTKLGDGKVRLWGRFGHRLDLAGHAEQVTEP